MRILHLHSEKGWSGGETQVKLLIDHLRAMGHINALVCPDQSVIAQTCRKEGYSVAGIEMRHTFDVRSIIGLAKTMKAFRPDIVHMHASKAHFLGVWAIAISGLGAVVILTRRMDYLLRRAALMRHFYSWHVNKVVAISSGVKKALVLSGVSEDHIRVIHSGIDTERFDRKKIQGNIREELGIAENRQVIGLIASFIKRKGHRYALMAMPKIIEKIPQALLLLVGDGPLRDELKNTAGQLGIAENVIFMGTRQRIPEILAGLNLLLLPSLSEGLGISLLEGMAMELPVVATRVGGIPESVHDDINGSLVPKQDPDALADRCIRILRNTELSKQMGREGRKIVQQQFSAHRMAEQYDALYKKLLGNKHDG